jgi:hypothetical protein
MRPRRLCALVAVAAVAIGCGSASPDLFVVRRSGPDPNANVTVVVSDGGSVTCNGTRHPLDAPRLLQAREVTRELAKQAQLNLVLPRGPGSELSYRVRLEAGTVRFSDTSRGNPRSFQELAAFTKDVTERVCGIMR